MTRAAQSRVFVDGNNVMGSGALLRQIATLRATMETTDNGHSPDSTRGSGNDNRAREELPTISNAEATDHENSS